MKKSDAIEHFGSASNVAKALNIHPAAVYQWPEIVPLRRAYELEIITNGELKAPRPNAPEVQAPA